MRFHLLHHLCEDLEKFCSIQILDVVLYEYFTVVRKRAYRCNSMRSAPTIQGLVFALKLIVHRLGMKGRDEDRENQSLGMVK